MVMWAEACAAYQYVSDALLANCDGVAVCNLLHVVVAIWPRLPISD